MVHTLIEKLLGEILHNMENLKANAVILRDEAFAAIGPADLALPDPQIDPDSPFHGLVNSSYT